MAQSDVYVNPSSSTGKFYPYVVDIQSTHVSQLATRIVLPIGYASVFDPDIMERLVPEIIYNGEALLILAPQISALPAKLLKNPVGSIAHLREQVIDALDFAIAGV
jgi:toxin CcdB